MMRTVFHVRKGDVVQVISGKEKSKTGKILRVNQKKNAVVIEKINIVKCHKKASGKNPGGIIEQEAPLHASKVLLYCGKCGHGVRTRKEVLESGKKVRFCKQCNTQLDK